MSNYDQFRDKLREIFMMNHAELDFGIYRIMNQKRDEINNFLDKVLLPQVKKILGGSNSANTAKLEQQLADAVKASEDAGFDPEMSPKVKQLREQIAASSAGNEELENEVFNHLTIFFSRYYDNGDFVSKRRYKDNAYAIPYNGEEVKLHWANSDQYYIKTSEYFQNYTFNVTVDEKTNARKKVHFVLKDATTEQNNNKAASGMERRFALYQNEEAASIEVIQNEEGENELNIYFTYELMPKSTKQDALMAEAFDSIKGQLPEDFKVLIDKLCPTEKNKKRTLLEKHLTDYTAKNSFDYFIHKDLGGFLRRELDFYIKNEVLLIDDLDEKHVMQQLNQVRAIKGVGEKIITMLAQIEDFQKRLWLKKKFVVQSDYCITLDRVPESFYAEICENEAQRKEWVKLFAIDEIEGDLTTAPYSEPLTKEFLCQNPFLVLDTAFFSLSFKHRLLSKMEDVDKNSNGLLINSDNYQALQLLQETYKNSIKCTYIDPPYNTSATPILYKNSYKDSSWMTMIADRVKLSRYLSSNNGYHSIAIDDVELHNLYKTLEESFTNHDFFQCIVNHYPGSGTGRSNVSKTHEYNIFVLPKDLDLLRGKQIEERQRTRGFSRSGTGENNYRYGRPNSFYAVLVNNESKEIIGVEPPPSLEENNYPKGLTKEGYLRIYPIGADGSERCWSLGYETAKVAIAQGLLQCSKSNVIHRLYFDESDWELLPSIWIDNKYSAVTNGTNLLTKIFGKSGLFSFPKSLYTVETAVYAGTYNDNNCIVFDYFGGSGTTGHAVIDINRVYGGNRKYVLCEMGQYFDNVTRCRIEKIIYSVDWEDGKPISRNGISQCFKYIRLEQYEDTLNNLEVKKKGDIFDKDEEFHESYMLQYMMDMETRDSLFNIDKFVHPFDVKLKTTRDNELVETNVDMVETFNYLIGLEVDTIRWTHNDEICVVEGRLHRNQDKALVIWRDTQKVDNTELNAFFRRNDYHVKDSEFDIIYVNGDNTLQNQKRDDEHWKVVLIEEEFQKRIFEEC